MGYLTLREALASNQLDAFVREQQDDGAELATGSELERGLALLITQRRSLAEEGRLGQTSPDLCNAVRTLSTPLGVCGYGQR